MSADPEEYDLVSVRDPGMPLPWLWKVLDEGISKSSKSALRLVTCTLKLRKSGDSVMAESGEAVVRDSGVPSHPCAILPLLFLVNQYRI